MKQSLHFYALVLICALPGLVWSQATIEQRVEALRSQLRDVEAREAELQAREKQLDEDLRPENIERALALSGSTRPEELREQRRRRLEAEKSRVLSQLELLATSRTRLETAITTAESESLRQNMSTGAGSQPLIVRARNRVLSSSRRRHRQQRRQGRRSRRHRAV